MPKSASAAVTADSQSTGNRRRGLRWRDTARTPKPSPAKCAEALDGTSRDGDVDLTHYSYPTPSQSRAERRRIKDLVHLPGRFESSPGHHRFLMVSAPLLIERETCGLGPRRTEIPRHSKLFETRSPGFRHSDRPHTSQWWYPRCGGNSRRQPPSFSGRTGRSGPINTSFARRSACWRMSGMATISQKRPR